MKLLFSIPLEEHEQPFSSPSYSYAGVLCVHDGQIIYCRQTYMENQPHLKEYVFTRDGQLLGTSLYPLPRPTELNDRWRYYASSAFSCIAIGQEWGFDLTTKTFSPMSDPLRATYVHDIHADEPYFYTDHVFHLPPYEIRHKGEFSYICSREGNPVWSFRTRGYLYTDMIQYHDAVVFGTAGMGGHFIALRLSDGSPLFDVNTKGTSHYIHRENTFYTYAGGKDGLLAVSLHGTSETLPLPGVTDDMCPLYLDDHRVLCLSCSKKGNRYTTVYLNAVELDE